MKIIAHRGESFFSRCNYNRPCSMVIKTITMKQVIIGIHGLGNKPPKYLLKKWWKDSIKEGFNKNGFKNELPEFELVYWADILNQKPLNNWEKDNPLFSFESEKCSINFETKMI